MTALRLAAALLLSLGGAACSSVPPQLPAGDAAPGTIVRAGCRQGQCAWLRVVGIEDVETRPEGRLRRMVARSGTSIHGDGDVPEAAPLAAIRWDVADRSDYAFCSARRPAYAFPDGGGGLLVHFLDLHDLAGYQLASAGLYMRLCHGRSAVPDAEGLRRLGYAPGTRSEQVEGQSLDSLTRF